MKRLLTPLLILGLGALAGCGSDTPTDPGPSVRNDRVVAEIRRMSTQHDCDPNEDNPGDFTLFVEIYEMVDGKKVLRSASDPYKQELKTRNGGGAAANYPAGKIRAAWDVPRIDGQRVYVEVHIEERDPGLDVALVRETAFSFDEEKDCWVTLNGRCNEITYRDGETFRDDEFHLFNPDDEGCQISAEWLITFEGA